MEKRFCPLLVKLGFLFSLLTFLRYKDFLFKNLSGDKNICRKLPEASKM